MKKQSEEKSAKKLPDTLYRIFIDTDWMHGVGLHAYKRNANGNYGDSATFEVKHDNVQMMGNASGQSGKIDKWFRSSTCQCYWTFDRRKAHDIARGIKAAYSLGWNQCLYEIKEKVPKKRRNS